MKIKHMLVMALTAVSLLTGCAFQSMAAVYDDEKPNVCPDLLQMRQARGAVSFGANLTQGGLHSLSQSNTGADRIVYRI